MNGGWPATDEVFTRRICRNTLSKPSGMSINASTSDDAGRQGVGGIEGVSERVGERGGEKGGVERVDKEGVERRG